MNYILFEKSAINILVGKKEFQSTEFIEGRQFIELLQGKIASVNFHSLCVHITEQNNIFFVGERCEKDFLLIDLEQSKLLSKETNPDDLLLVLQKVFRTAIRIWDVHPFTSSERLNGSKSIVFPFVYGDHRRIVVEREPNCERLRKRGINRPLLVYKYGTDDAPKREEIADTEVLRDAGELYLKLTHEFQQHFRAVNDIPSTYGSLPLLHTSTGSQVSDGGFMYLHYSQRLEQLTTTQKKVVEDDNLSSPIRIDGPAGTGKTTSMIMRAWRLLEKARVENLPFNIVFFSHSDSTDFEAKQAFSIFENSDYYTSRENPQKILFTTLFDFCIQCIGAQKSEIIEYNAGDAKQSQRILIEEALNHVLKTVYKSYKPLLSEELKNSFNEEQTPKAILISMLQHEFGVQIKGRTDCTIEEYYKLPYIDNALHAKHLKDKEFVFSIFKEYQKMLEASNVFDIDDITLQALSQWNAPFWRRERGNSGFDYIFVDEMHLFDINEQHAFHYLTKSAEQKQIPICFALDYSQALGDRGNIQQDYIKEAFGQATEKKYKTIFRSSQQITDFCASISAAGALMFQSSYKNPYDTPTSGFTSQEEALCQKPCLFMYMSDEEMINAIKTHIDVCRKETNCKNSDIAIISFEPSLLQKDNIELLSGKIQSKITLLKDRQLEKPIRTEDHMILSSPYNVNGLEFKCVILVGVDEGRVPQSAGVNDISVNYIKYIAFNQLYLTSSRAKYRLILMGNDNHGISSCLNYALTNETIEQKQ